MDIPKTPKGQRTKARILDAAIKLINERGFESVTLNDICEASGAAIGTFYHYFDSPREIFHEILKAEGEALIAYYEKSRPADPIVALRRILKLQLAYFEKKGKRVVANIYSMEMLSARGSRLLSALLPLPRLVGDIVRRAQEAGDIRRELDPDDCAMVLLSLMLTYSMVWIDVSERRTLREICFDHLMRELDRMRSPAPR